MQPPELARDVTSDVLAYSVEQVAAKLNICAETARSRIKDGSIPHIKLGRRVLVPVAALNEVLNAKPAIIA